MDVLIGHGVLISQTELQFSTSRSRGPGGQHVNKVNSRVTLQFDIKKSACLSSHQKKRILASLQGRVNKEGVLQIHSQKYRSQRANRQDLLERFGSLLNTALTPKPARVPTKISKRVKEKRLQEKKHHSRVKQIRSTRQAED